MDIQNLKAVGFISKYPFKQHSRNNLNVVWEGVVRDMPTKYIQREILDQIKLDCKYIIIHVSKSKSLKSKAKAKMTSPMTN